MKRLLNFLVAAAALALSGTASAASYYAAVSANPDGNGGGKFYASTTATESTGSYSASANSASKSGTKKNSSVSGFYLYAFPDFGYKFSGWSTSASSTSMTSTLSRYGSFSATSGSSSGTSNAKTTAYYAHFTSGATVKDVYLGKGDSVQLYFYNSTSKAWSARVNSTFLGTSISVSGEYASYTFSAGDATSTKTFNVKVTATAVGDDDEYDELTIQDYAANVYHYRIHVIDQYQVSVGASIEIPAASFASKTWSTTLGATGYMTASLSPTTASDAVTATVTGVKERSSTTTLTLKNYASGTTTGALGATYTFNILVSKPAYTYYAKVRTAVVGAVAGDLGKGWAYASKTYEEFSEAYQSTPSDSETLSATSNDEESCEVGDFYIFAFPNPGYRFAGWSKNDPDGAIVSGLPAYHMEPLTVVSSSRDSENPAVDTYYAHFTDQDVEVQDITLAVGDEVKLSFYNDTAETWSLQVVYTNANTDVIVDMDGTEAHDGGYATFRRSADVSDKVNEFSMYLKATKASGDDFDQLSISDYEGNIYHYRVHVVHERLVEKDETVSLPLAAHATRGWSVSSSADSVATVSAGAGATAVTGVAKGSATIAASNYAAGTTTGALGAEYAFAVHVIEPWPVEFCMGDSVQIWYHNSVDKTWFLLINGERFEANTPGIGTQMTVTLNAENPTTDSDIIGVTREIGADGTSDLVVITDGENFYAYRMGVRARREIGIGQSVSMTCTTVATSPWRLQVPSTAEPYVETEFEASVNGGHSSTVTITGEKKGENVTLYVANQLRDDSINAQGAIYTIVLDVTGASVHEVNLCNGASVTWSTGYENATAESVYTVTPALSESGTLSASVARDGAVGVTTTLTASDAAVYGQQQTFTVTDQDGNDVVKYKVNAYAPFSMSVGQVAPGCLDGSTVPWVVWTSDAVNFPATPVLYNKLNSGRIEAKAPGEYFVWATNAADNVRWFGVRARVYDKSERVIVLPFGATTNITVSAVAGLAAEWTVTRESDIVTASLNGSGESDTTTVTLVGGNAQGVCHVIVKNDYHEEELIVYVGGDPSKNIVIGGRITVQAGYNVHLPSECTDGADWTAFSENQELVSFVEYSGPAGTDALVIGHLAGEEHVVVKTATTDYIYEVEVLRDEHELDPITVGVGYTVTTNLTDILSALSGAVVSESADNMTAQAYAMNGALTITGVQDGTTRLTLATANDYYYLPIIVHERRIVKAITLLVGEKSSHSTYSYTFDRVIAIRNGNPDRVTVTQSGNTVTITPLAIGVAQVEVDCYVDGLTESSTLIYGVTIKQASDGYIVKDFDEGYLVYRETDAVREIDGDLVFVYTNVNEFGSFKIPDGYAAKADILAVGGGGGGGSVATGFGRGGGGGGAGGFSLTEGKRFTAGSFGVQVGAGGIALSSQIGGVSLKGSNGGDSVLTNSYGYVVAIGNGGGGGAAPADGQYSGDDGGSGGGGSWILDYLDGAYTWIPGRGGFGVDGQGCSGGTPTETNCGGGGGGAGGDGSGGQSRGPGRYSTLSGKSVLYAVGGSGGRSDVMEQAASGQGFGFGGDGGNGGPGGNGGDGAVVIRFHRLYRNVLVPVPTTNDLITARFEWSESTNCVPFNYYGRSFRSSSDAHPYNWEDVIESVQGTTNVVCVYDETGTNKVGIGYYNFNVKLKDGFAWEDEDDPVYGSTEKLTYRWVVVEDWSSIDAILDVGKTVWWSDKSNATVRVDTAASPETSGGGDPKVLFIGSLCGAHGFTSDILNTALNAVTEVGDVDYYFFNRTFNLNGITTDDAYNENDPPYFQGSLKKGETRSGTVYAKNPNSSDAVVALENAQGNHGTMNGFYNQLYTCITNGTASTYDYIIFSFDRARLAERFEEVSEHEAEVAEFLRPYYAQEKVIWLIDNQNDSTAPSSVTVTPWHPSVLTCFNTYWETLDQGVNYWQDSSSILKGYVNDGSYAYHAYNAMVGLMCPSNYPVDKVTYMENVVYGATSSSFWTAARLENVAATECEGIANQCVYDNAENVADLIKSTVKVKPFNLYYKDKIVKPADGLVIKSVEIDICFKGDGTTASKDEADWVALMHWDAATGEVINDDPDCETGIEGASMTVDITNNLVTAVISNVAVKAWVRYDTRVFDVDGKFCSSDGANYNEATGQYEKNPNDGAAYLAMVDDLGVGVGVEGGAETKVPWRYTAYQITGYAQNGSVFVAGTTSSRLSCAEGRDVTVYYRGNGGYRLTAITVDNRSVEVTSANNCCYTFKELSDNHVISVAYTPYYGTITPMATTNEYDGLAHVPDVELKGWDETYARQLRYSLTEDGEYLTKDEFQEFYSTNRAVTCAGDHLVYCRAYAYQPGYGTTLNDHGWVWVDTRVVESGTVTITPKPLTLTAVSFKIEGADVHATLDQWRGVTVEGIVAGDTVNTNGTLTWSCPAYEQKMGQYPIYPVKAEGVTDEDVAGGDYEIFYEPGVLSVEKGPMLIGGVQQASWLDPEDEHQHTGVERIEKTYDGLATNLVLSVDEPTADIEGGLRVCYSYDDGLTWTDEIRQMVDAGTNKVWYAVEAGDDFESSIYFWVTNYNYVIINPRPLTITAASAAKTYDGTALTAASYEITEGTLAVGDTLASVEVTGSRIAVGESANVVSGAIIRSASATERENDYDITYMDGTLVVTPGPITIGGVTYVPGSYVPYGETGVADVEKTYDGLGTNIVVNVSVPASGAVVRYSTNTVHDAVWIWETDPQYVDAGNYVVYFLVEADNYASVTNFARVIINPREILVKISDAQMREGGTEPEYSAILVYADNGEVVPAEVAAALDFELVTATEPLSSGMYDIVLSGETVQGNYSLTYESGTLTVHDKLEIEYTVSGVSVPYDGLAHTIDLSVDSGVPSPVIRYALSEDGPWSETAPSVTGATSGIPVYYTITSTEEYQPVNGVVVITVIPLAVTVKANDAEKWERDSDPAFTATVSGTLAGDESLIVYTVTPSGTDVGTNELVAAGETAQGNYTVNYQSGKFVVKPWVYPAGPDHEHVAVDYEWVKEQGGFDGDITYAAASNYVFGVGENGVTNWINYVLGLDPHSVSSVVYLDLAPSLLSVTNPTLLACGATVRPMPIGGLTNVVFRLMRSSSPTGTFEKVEDTYDGVFPQDDVPAQYYRIDTRFLFKQK